MVDQAAGEQVDRERVPVFGVIGARTGAVDQPRRLDDLVLVVPRGHQVT